jgi:hypothetical protein
VFSAIDLSIAIKACSNINENHPRIPSTVELATVTTAAGRLYSSTYATPQFMLRPLAVAIDPSTAKRRCNSTCGIHRRMPRPSTVRTAIRSFSNEEALRQHLRNSPAHAFDCDDCDRAFDSEEALQ